MNPLSALQSVGSTFVTTSGSPTGSGIAGPSASKAIACEILRSAI